MIKPNERWVVHRDELEVLGVQFTAELDDGETITAVIEVKVLDAAGVDVSSDVRSGSPSIADFTDRAGIVHANAAIHFTKKKAAGALQPAGTYRVEIEGRTSTGRELVALMRDRRFPVLLIVDGLAKP